MGISVPNLLEARKFPFILLLSTLLICATILWYSNTNQSSSIPFSDLNHRSSPLPTKPTPQTPPPPPPTPTPTTPSSNTKGSDSRDNASISKSENKGSESRGGTQVVYDDAQWRLCKGTVAVDFIPCLDNMQAVKALPSRRHMEHRERHCPKPSPRCLVPMPQGYKLPVAWPKSRDMIWYDNVPHPKLVEYKKNQNWVKKVDNYLVFPGGGTQFKDGVTNYITFIEKTLPTIKWGTHTRVVLDVGCGVASFGGYLLDKDVITMSFAPKDEHEAQIQFALERGIPAALAVIGTQKLIFPDSAFDLIHCARCRVHWDADGGKPLIELNRILRPGGFFVWSATPVYRTNKRDSGIWDSMVALTNSMCWEVVAKAVDSTGIGLVIYQKPQSYTCYQNRQKNDPPLCEKDSQRIPWYEPLDKCLTRLPVDSKGSFLGWPTEWPSRLNSRPPSLVNNSDAAQKFYDDAERWSVRISEVYMRWLAINWTGIRNIMDMNAIYGGFAAALVGRPHWVMNVVPVGMPDTLPVIFDRGLIGLYHDWCESLSTYPRTYDLLHAHFLFETLTERCDIVDVAVEMDRIVRPRGYIVVQDSIEMINKLNPIFRSLHWKTEIIGYEFLVGNKTSWRPSQ